MILKITNRYLKAATVNILFFILNTIFFLIVTPIALRVMGKDFYGLWSILCAIMLFSNVGNLGMGSIVNKFASESPGEIDKRDYLSRVFTSGVLIVLPMAILIFLALFLFRNILTKALIDDIYLRLEFSKTLLIVGLSMVPQFMSHVYQGLLLSQLENKTVRIIELTTSISLWFGPIIIVSLFGKSIFAVSLWCFVNSLLSLFLYVLVVRKISEISFIVDKALIRKMLNFSGYMFIESVAINLFQQIDRVILGIAINPSIAGVYSIGTSVGSRLTMVVGQITSVMVPYASLKNSINDQEKLFLIFRRVSKYVSLIIGLIGGLGIIWMQTLLSLWITPAFAVEYTNAFRILIVAYCWLTLCRPAHQTLTGLGKVKFTSIVYLLLTLGMLITLFEASKSFGIVGAEWANAIMAILLIYNLYLYRKFSPKKVWSNFFTDLNFGILIPIFCYLFILSSPPYLLMTALTLIICGLFVIQFIKDDWVMALIKGLYKANT